MSLRYYWLVASLCVALASLESPQHFNSRKVFTDQYGYRGLVICCRMRFNVDDSEYIKLWSDSKTHKRVVTKLFRMWSKRLLRSSAAHYAAAEKFEAIDARLTKFNMLFAIAVLLVSNNPKIAIIAIAVLSYPLSLIMEISSTPEESMPLVVPIISLLVVLSSAIQYIMQYSKKAMDHKQAGNEFSNLRRKIERYWTKGEVHQEAIHSLNRAYNAIVKNPPLVPRKIWLHSLDMKKEEIELINKFFYCFDGEEDSIHPHSCP